MRFITRNILSPLPGYLIVLGAVALFSIAGCAKTPRDPSLLEINLMRFAWDVGSAEVCTRIPPEAIEEKLFNLDGRQIASIQSKCFFGVAVNSRDSSYCSRVKSVTRSILSGHYYSKENCKEKVEDSDTKQWHQLLDNSNLEVIMSMLGYNYSELIAECKNHVKSSLPKLGVQVKQMSKDQHMKNQMNIVYALFGSHTVNEVDLPHWYCGQIYRIDVDYDSNSVQATLTLEQPPEEILRSYLQRIYKTKLNYPKIYSRIKLIPDQK